MKAAEVMRGEKTMADITYKYDEEKDIYGSYHPRPTALAKATGLADYGDDLALKMPEGVAHLAVVFGEAYHANIIDIDVSEAEKMPGVFKVVTAKDVRGTNNIDFPPLFCVSAVRPHRFPIICGEKICLNGDVVAHVASDTREQALAAAKGKQSCRYSPLYMTLRKSYAQQYQLHKNFSQLLYGAACFKGEDASELSTTRLSGWGSFHSRMNPHPIEPTPFRAIWASTACCYPVQGSGYNRGKGIHRAAAPLRWTDTHYNEHVGGSFGYSVTPAHSSSSHSV
jgi:aldehyde oxidoreductase